MKWNKIHTRGCRKFFLWWRDWVKILKLQWLKCPKTITQKTKFGPKNKWLKKTSYIWSLSTNFEISGKVSKLTKTSKRVHSFYNTVSLKKPYSFYEPQLTQHYKIYTLATQLKTYFWLVSEKSICAAPFLDAQERHSRCTCKINICLFL